MTRPEDNKQPCGDINQPISGDNSKDHSGELDNVLDRHFVRFFQTLRYLGLRISTAETIDALTALLFTDLADREMVKTTFRVTLCKDRDSQRIFDQAFDSFFVPGDDLELRQRMFKQQKEETEAAISQAENELSFYGGEGEEQWEIKVDVTEEQKDTYSQLPEEEKQKIREFLAAHQEGNQVNDPYDLLASAVRGQLNFWQRKLKEEQQQTGTKRPLPVQTGNDEIDELLGHITDNLREEDSLVHQDMRDIGEKDLPKISLIIRKLTKKLATRISRRYRQSTKKQRVDLRRTIRHNIRYGGTLMRLEYKTKKVDRPNLLLVCDVSASMARYATFVLQFTYGLSSVAKQIESFIFSDDLERISPYFGRGGSFESIMEKVIEQSEIWGEGTDLGYSLGHLWQNYPRLLNRDTVVILVSDGKTIAPGLAAHYLQKVHRRVKEVIWLNTSPKKEWSGIKQVQQLKRYSKIFECNTLAHLEKIMRQLNT